MRSSARSSRHVAAVIGIVVWLAWLTPATASAATPSVDIHSTGPLSDIYIGNDLSCQVRSGGFTSTEYFPNAPGPGDCGTLLFTGADNAASALFGPDFANHAGGTNTTGHLSASEQPFTPVSQSLTGSGTAASPYVVQTVVTESVPTSGGPRVLQLTELDTYIAGNDFYTTSITIANTGSVSLDSGAELYHAADCQLRGSTTGLAAFEPSQASANTAACTVTALDNPPSALEQFTPITPGDDWVEGSAAAVWAQVGTQNFGDVCQNCNGRVGDNASGIEYEMPNGLAPGDSISFSFQTNVIDTVPTGGFSLSGTVGGATSGTVATITDPDTGANPSAYSARIDWGDGGSSAGTVSGGNGSFTVTASHAYAAAGTFPVTVTITAVGTNQGTSAVTDSATITPPPPPPLGPLPRAPAISSQAGPFTGSVNPGGLPTTAFFQYALDPKYTGGGPVAYTQSTPPQPVGSDFSSHNVAASVNGLVPNALYHVRLVATNSAGTTFGPDVPFTTAKTPPPGPPTLGRTFNVSPVSGIVLVKLHGQFVPLTELQQIPTNTVINALHGTLKLITAGGGAHPAHDRRGKSKTQAGRFGGAIFTLKQSDSGLATLTLVEGAFAGAPTYATCKKHKQADASAAALSSRTLQLLHASAHGKFRTSGRYSAATVRGTKWTIADRCNGTLTRDIADSVAVTDFVRHKTIILHAGQTYLAKARR